MTRHLDLLLAPSHRSWEYGPAQFVTAGTDSNIVAVHVDPGIRVLVSVIDRDFLDDHRELEWRPPITRQRRREFSIPLPFPIGARCFVRAGRPPLYDPSTRVVVAADMRPIDVTIELGAVE